MDEAEGVSRTLYVILHTCIHIYSTYMYKAHVCMYVCIIHICALYVILQMVDFTTLESGATERLYIKRNIVRFVFN